MSDALSFPRLVESDPLDAIKRRIIDARQLLNQSDAGWVEGSIQIARALREGRDLMPAHKAFSQWLKKNQLDFYGPDARAALIGLAGNEALAREVLTKNESRSHIVVWREVKERFRNASKTTSAKVQGPLKRKRKSSVVRVNRAMKLGAETLLRLKGTSLDRAAELEELVMLNRGAQPGEHTAVVRQLIEDAVAGKAVSAIATGAKITGRESPPAERLIEAFKQRMTFIWEQADYSARQALIEHLMNELGEKP